MVDKERKIRGNGNFGKLFFILVLSVLFLSSFSGVVSAAADDSQTECEDGGWDWINPRTYTDDTYTNYPNCCGDDGTSDVFLAWGLYHQSWTGSSGGGDRAWGEACLEGSTGLSYSFGNGYVGSVGSSSVCYHGDPDCSISYPGGTASVSCRHGSFCFLDSNEICGDDIACPSCGNYLAQDPPFSCYTSCTSYEQCVDGYTCSGSSCVERNRNFQITDPTSSSPVSVSGGDSVTAYFTLEDLGSNVTSGVNIDGVWVGGNLANYSLGGSITQIDYEDFSTDFGNWAQATFDSDDWSRGTSTPSGNTGPQSTYDGTFAYVETSSGSCNNPETAVLYQSPLINFSEHGYINVNFAYNMYDRSNSDMGTLHIKENSSGSWNSVWSKSGNQGNSWHIEDVELRDLSGEGTIAIWLDCGTGYRSDAAVDSVNVTGNPTYFGYVPGQGWQVNFIAPSGLDGPQDLEIQVTYDGETSTDTESNAILYSSPACTSATVTDIDSNVYDTVSIGDQCWMAENLKTTTYRDGTNIPYITNNNAWASDDKGAYSWYDNNESNKDIYGALYNGYAVLNDSGLCPDGWHVPTDFEIMNLEMELGMSYSSARTNGWRGTNEGSKLSGNADLWTDGDLDSNSSFGSSGFDLLPGGSRNYDGTIYGILGNDARFWSSTLSEAYSFDRLWRRYLSYTASSINKEEFYGRLNEGFSVRCIEDSPRVDSAILNSSLGTNTTEENLTLYFSSINSFGDMETATTATTSNITDWRLNGSSLAVLNMPFDSQSPSLAKDYSTNGNNGTVSGATWNSSCQVGGCYDFDGAGDYILDDDGEDYINGLSAFTISTWIKSDTTSTDKGFIFGKDPSGGDDTFGIRYDAVGASGGQNNVIKAGITSTSGSVLIESSANKQTTSWQHVVLTWESGNPMELYLDGSKDSLSYDGGSLAGTITGATKLLIGKGTKDSSGSWDGKIDEVQIYDYALSPEQINSIYQNGVAGHGMETLVSQETSVGDNYTVQVTPNDGSSDGTSVDSNWLLVEDVATSELQITDPTTSNPETVSAGDNVTAYFNFLNGGSNVTSGVDLESVFVGGQEATVVSESLGYVFYDNFSTDTTGDYTWETIETHSPTNSHNWDSVNEWVEIRTGDNDDEVMGRTVDIPTEGYAEIIFVKRADYPHDNLQKITFYEDSNNYYKFLWQGSNYDSQGVEKYVGGVLQDSSYETGTVNTNDQQYTVEVWWNSTYMRLDIEGVKRKEITTTDTTAINPSYFNISSFQADLDLESIKICGDETCTGSGAEYVSGQGWQVNFTAPSGLSGYQDLFINATYNGETVNDNESDALVYGDIVAPLVDFVSSTLGNGQTTNNNFIEVNVSSSDVSRGDGDVSNVINFDNSLVSWWRMDDVSGNTVEDYMNRNDGTISGATQTSDGALGDAFSFDGTDDYVGIGDDSSLDFTSESFTLSAWINPSGWGENNYGRIIAKGDTTSNTNYEIYVRGTDSNLGFKETSNAYSSNTGVLSLNNWQHVLVSYDGSDISFYVNGVSEGSATAGPLTQNNYDFYIGGISNNFEGSIDDVMIFNRSLSAEEVAGLYANTTSKYTYANYSGLSEGTYSVQAYAQDTAGNVNVTESRDITYSAAATPTVNSAVLNSSSGTNTTDENLTVWIDSSGSTSDITDWRLNGSSLAVLNMPMDSNANDYSTYSNDGTVSGATHTTAGCKVGACYDFDGVDDYILTDVDSEVDYLFADSSSRWSWGGWFKGSHGIIGGLAGGIGGATTNAIYMDNGDLKIRLRGEADDLVKSNIDTSEWHFAYVTWDGNTAYGYFDNEDPVELNVGTAGIQSTYDFGIADPTNGGVSNFDRFEGFIDEVMIFNRALSPEQIQEIYQAGLEGHQVEKMVSQETSVGDNYTVQVTPNDGSSDGTSVDSNWLLVENTSSTPGAVQVIYPSDSGITVYDGTEINWTSTSSPDGDPVKHTVRYSDDSGSTWTTIVDNWGFINEDSNENTEFQESSSGTQSHLFYVDVPKVANVSRASLALEGISTSGTISNSISPYCNPHYSHVYSIASGSAYSYSLPTGAYDKCDNSPYTDEYNYFDPGSYMVFRYTGVGLSSQDVDVGVDTYLRGSGYWSLWASDDNSNWVQCGSDIYHDSSSHEQSFSRTCSSFSGTDLYVKIQLDSYSGSNVNRYITFWDVTHPSSGVYPSDVSLDVTNDGDNEFSHSGDFSTKNTTSDFSDEMNSYIGSSSAELWENVSVPFELTFTDSKINISDINIEFTDYYWNTSQIPSGDNYRVKVIPFDVDGLGISDISDNDFTILHCNPLTGKKFEVKNSTGSTCFEVNVSGDAVVYGNLIESCSSSPTGNAFEINDAVGNRIAWINESCDMCVSGSFNDGQSLSYSGTGEFYIRDLPGNVLLKAYFSSPSGNVDVIGNGCYDYNSGSPKGV